MANTAAYRGAGVYIYSGSATLTNNTITRNRNLYSGSTTAGLLIWPGATASGKNNIICDNSATANPNISGTGSMSYCNIGGGFPGTGNIDANPLFVNLPGTYCLLSQVAAGQSQNSPSVNTGDPGSAMVTGTTRTDHVQDAGIVDMGFHWPLNPSTAAHFARLMDESDPTPQVQQALVPTTMTLSIGNYPNPFNPTTTISLVLNQAAVVDLKVFDLAGRMVTGLFQGHLEAGQHEFQFSGASLPAGVYLYRADVSGNIVTGKALLVK
jgi:hypothetical protein